MTAVMQWPNRTRDHAVGICTMPIGLKQHIFTEARAGYSLVMSISCFAQGRSVPIFRGGPPRSG
jgi:hypothetical protein